MSGPATARLRGRQRLGIGAAAAALVGLAIALGAVVDRSPDTVASLDPASLAAPPATTITPSTTASPSTTTTTTSTTTSSTTTTSTTTTTTATSTTTSSTTTAAPPPAADPMLAVQPSGPIAPPQDAHGDEPHVELGRIAIPEIGLEAPLLEGIRLSTLDRGPGHWPGSAMPGEVGNVVVAAHRTSNNAEFRHLDELEPGDEVSFSTSTGDWTYAVTRTHIVYPDALWITDPTPTATATLFACHPLGSTAQRIVVDLELTP